MTQLPKISVVTPSYNQARFLPHTMDSVLDQKYPNLEYIVIDGGSTDGSYDIIRGRENELSYWCSEEDGGHADALQKGFDRSTGEVMAWLNSDDMYLPWTLRTVAEIFEHFPEVNWIVGYNGWWSESGVLTNARRVPKGIYDYLLGNYKWIQQESVFWRRSLWDAAGGHVSKDYRLMVDGELWSRFMLHDPMITVDCILSGYRVHGSNRAILHVEDCLREMDDIIENLKTQCPADKLSKLRILRMFSLVERIGLHKILPVSATLRYMLPDFYKSISHTNIHYQNGAWQKRQIPFTLFPPLPA